MDIAELKSSLQACQEILEELPITIHNSIVETEENLKFLGMKLDTEKGELEEEIQNYQESNQEFTKQKNLLKRQLIELEKIKLQREIEKNRDALKEKDLNTIGEERELEEELRYHNQMISYLKSKLNLYSMCAKIGWDLESSDICGKVTKNKQEFPFNINHATAYDTVNELWRLID